MNRIKTSLLAVSAFLFPFVAGAQDNDVNLDGITALITQFGDIVSLLIPIMAGLAVVFFFYGLARYILAAGDEEAKDSGRRIMIGGIIALFIITALGGILGFIGGIFGIDTDDSGTVDTPGIEGLEN